MIGLKDNTKEKEYLFMLSHVTGLGAISIRRLGEYFGSYEAVWNCERNELSKNGVLNDKRQEAFWDWHKKEGD